MLAQALGSQLEECHEGLAGIDQRPIGRVEQHRGVRGGGSHAELLFVLQRQVTRELLLERHLLAHGGTEVECLVGRAGERADKSHEFDDVVGAL